MSLKQLSRFFISSVLMLSLGACASLNSQKEKPLPEARADKSLVYFYRESRFLGWAISYNVRDGEDVIGALASGTYFYYFAEPGHHRFSAHTEAESARELNLEAGKTYYLRGGVEMGILAGRPSLTIVDSSEAQSVLPQLTYAIKPKTTKKE